MTTQPTPTPISVDIPVPISGTHVPTIEAPDPLELNIAGELPRTMIATITRQDVHAGTIGAINSAIGANLAHWWHIRTHGPYLDNARNACVRYFQAANRTAVADDQPPYDVLLFIDSDMRPTNADFAYVLSSCTPDRPVVGGLYLNPDAENFARPVIYGMDEHGFLQFPAAPTPGTGLVQVNAVGTGFMAIHATLLDQMIERFGRDPEGLYGMPWFDEVPWDNELADGTMGEDLVFCLRCSSMDVPVYVHLDAKVGHYKEVLLLP